MKKFISLLMLISIHAIAKDLVLSHMAAIASDLTPQEKLHLTVKRAGKDLVITVIAELIPD